jgi:hypothetical protein
MDDQTEAPELLKICPFCGGEICRVEITDAGGKRAFSLCCGIPLEILDNWEVFEPLPDVLKQAAIDKIQAEYAAMDEQSAENARRFKEADEHWRATCPHLFKSGEQAITPV